MQSITKVFSDIVKPYIDDADENLQNQLNINGAVNMLSNNATSQVINGVTFTVNSDGTVTANGTATAVARLSICTPTILLNLIKKYKKLKLTGCPSGGSSSSCNIYCNLDGTYPTDIGNGTIIIGTENSESTTGITIQIASGATLSNFVFKPMLSLVSLNFSYDDYVPYAKSNKELTEDVAVKLGGTPTANTTYIDTSDLHYEQFGKVTHVFGTFVTKTAIASSDALVQLFTDLPNSNGGMGGTSGAYTLCLLHDSTNDGLAYRCFVSTDGALVSRYKAIPIGMYFADFTYISA